MKHASETATERRWRRLVAEQEASGQSVRDFACARGLSAWSLYGWRSRLGRTRPRRRSGAGEGGADAIQLVPVDLVDDAHMGVDRSGAELEVVVDDRVRVRVPRGFDAGELARLLAVVARSC